MNTLSKILPVLLLSSVLLEPNIGFAAEGVDELITEIEVVQQASEGALDEAKLVVAETLENVEGVLAAAEGALDEETYAIIARSLQSFVRLGVLDLNSEEELPDLADIAAGSEYLDWAAGENIENPQGFLDALVRLEMLYFVYEGSLMDASEDVAAMPEQGNEPSAQVEETSLALSESLAIDSTAINDLIEQTNQAELTDDERDKALESIKEIEEAVVEVEQLANIQAEGLTEIQATNDALITEMESFSDSMMSLFSDDEKQLIEQNYEDYGLIRSAAGLNN